MSEHTTLDATTGAPLGEISQAPPALEVFLDKHQMKLVILAALLAIGAAAYVVYEGIEQSNEETAGGLLAKAEDISDLQGVVKNHEGTAAADSAIVLLAERQWEDSQEDDAIATLKSFIESGAGHPALPSAKSSLASKLLVQGKQDEASELFHELADDSDTRFLAPYAWISIGDIELSKGNTEAAAKAYGTVGKEFPGSPFAQEANQRGLLLKAKAPEEVTASIVVPEVNLTGDKDGSGAPVETNNDDLLDVLKGNSVGTDTNPLLEEPKDPEQ
jgi:predicted negative regulator of RcsB-dependent stress response